MSLNYFKYDERTNMYSYDSKPVFAKHDMDGEIVDMVLTSCLMAKTELLQEVYRKRKTRFNRKGYW